MNNSYRRLVEDSSRTAIHRLPDELLAEIFQSGNIDTIDGGPDIAYLSTIISVCSVWRNAAVSAPTLWTNIFYSSIPDLRFEEYLYILSAFLDRSKNADIDITLRLDGESVARARRIQQVVYPHLHRCRSLWLIITDPRVKELYLPLRGTLTALRNLHISYRDHDGGTSVQLFDTADLIPLQELSLVGVMPTSFEDVPENALSAIRFIDLPARRLLDVMNFVQRCSALTELVLLERAPWARQHRDLPTFALPNLTFIEVVDDLPMHFRRCIAAPRLAEVIIYGIGIELEDPRPVEQGPSPLERVTLKYFYPLNAHSLCAFFISHPNLNVLTVVQCHDHGLIPAILLGLEPHDMAFGEPLLPHLEKLTFCLSYQTQAQRLADWFRQLLDQRQNLHISCDRRGLQSPPSEYDDMLLKYGGRFTEVPDAAAKW